MSKRIKIISFIFLMLFVSICTNAQNGMNFQGVARTTNGVVLSSQAISVRLSFLQGSASGNSVYQEVKTITTNAQGVFNFVIGDGTGTNSIGDYNKIVWSNGPYFLRIEIDPAAGNNFTIMGTTQLQYVPFAHYSKSVDANNIIGNIPVSKGGTGVGNLQDLKTSLEISNVDNTSDIQKPISSMTQVALNLKLNISDSVNSYVTPTQLQQYKFDTTYIYQAIASKASSNSPNFTGTVTGITKSMVGLSNVDNTADINKVISTATQAALDLKSNVSDVNASLLLKENISNKSTANDLGGLNPSDELYPTQKAVKEYVTNNSASGGIADGGITSIKLANASVTNDKIAGTIPVSLGGTGVTTMSDLKSSIGLNSAAFSSTNDFELPLIFNAPLNRSSNVISIPIANATTNGYLSKNDWLVFNGKQNTLIAGSDFLAPNGSAASLTNFPILNQNTTGNAATALIAGNITATTNTTLTSLSNLNTVGTIISGTWSGSTIAVSKGGTGVTSSTGSGSLVLSNSPQLTSPNIGSANGTTLNLSGQISASSATIAGTLTANAFVGDGSALTNVYAQNIADGTIMNNHINNNASISYSKLNLSNSIVGSDIANSSINSNKLVGTDISTVGTITTGTWSASTISIANGGTGATNASSARSNLGLGTAALNNTSDFAQLAGSQNNFQGDLKAKTFTLNNPTPINSATNSVLDLSNGNVLELVLVTSTTLSFTNPKVGTYIIKIKQDASGNHTLTFPSIKWADQAVPTITPTAYATDIITLIYDGSEYYASCLQNF